MTLHIETKLNQMTVKMNNLQVKEEGAAMEASKWMHITEMKARRGFKNYCSMKESKNGLVSWKLMC